MTISRPRCRRSPTAASRCRSIAHRHRRGSFYRSRLSHGRSQLLRYPGSGRTRGRPCCERRDLSQPDDIARLVQFDHDMGERIAEAEVAADDVADLLKRHRLMHCFGKNRFQIHALGYQFQGRRRDHLLAALVQALEHRSVQNQPGSAGAFCPGGCRSRWKSGSASKR